MCFEAVHFWEVIPTSKAQSFSSTATDLSVTSLSDEMMLTFLHSPKREIWWQLRSAWVFPSTLHQNTSTVHSGHLVKEKKKKTESLIRPQMSEVFLFSMGERLSTSQVTAAQRAMHFWNDNHLTVRFCDTLQPRWWMTYQIREMTDVSRINTFPP